ncbi:alpha/beta fold hydrolase [Massilia sp. YIM B02763]|uniref:alpha/beta hydrolase family protein n=1 Tax=Massilia sp. YIM B02763 TaxID=3050130 RepID=UPI0025B69E40|nr:alpha/beta fold hydrolase [Massilia sp. YIM B02763]MDN4052744.1 alpha/beta fold hydrolase [Massilia sp. YIM B02763]
MLTERIDFPGPHGKISAKLDAPDGTPRAYGIFAHCFTCSKDVLAATRIAQGLAAQGVAVLRFDFAGLGASAGDFADTNFSSNVDDLVTAADFLRAKFAAPALLIGHSLGGAAVLAAAHRVPEAKAVVTIAAPSDPHYVVDNLLSEHLDTITKLGEARVRLAGRNFNIRRHFVEDAARHKIHEHIAKLGRALLVMHAPQDDTVSMDNATRIFELAQHPKSFISLDGIDHLITGREDGAYVAGIIAAWSARYLA